ncbi:BlaI/MecI/CopY family transcriptional regulator [Nonomuraea sp. NPDC049784]|uniref:BlaI/MecI/CopY family transcriptional regulator n=1 Tax=Nonomuraea sp. NPDC049784 TaxID=3154361 RepID=UPI0033F06222
MADRSPKRRDRGALEAQILAIMAAGDHPLTPAEVAELLDDSLAYTTVMTVLARLYEKGSLTRVRQGRAFAYSFIRDEDARRALQMRKVLDEGSNKASVLAHFVEELSDEDENILQQLLQQAAHSESET